MKQTKINESLSIEDMNDELAEFILLLGRLDSQGREVAKNFCNVFSYLRAAHVLERLDDLQTTIALLRYNFMKGMARFDSACQLPEFSREGANKLRMTKKMACITAREKARRRDGKELTIEKKKRLIETAKRIAGIKD